VLRGELDRILVGVSAFEVGDAYLATAERQSSASERHKLRTITDPHGQPAWYGGS
jgi:hypothetical protein